MTSKREVENIGEYIRARLAPLNSRFEVKYTDKGNVVMCSQPTIKIRIQKKNSFGKRDPLKLMMNALIRHYKKNYTSFYQLSLMVEEPSIFIDAYLICLDNLNFLLKLKKKL